MSDTPEFDVLIAGGGLVGSALALALSGGHSLRVGLVEPHKLRVDRSASGYDDRSVALAHGTRLILDQLDIWPDIRDAAEPIENIHISERGRFGATRLNAREEGVPALGYVVENRLLGKVFLNRLKSSETVTLLDESEVSAAREDTDGVNVELKTIDGPLDLKAQLLVAADGAGSALRSMVGIEAREYDYRQSAIVANISAEKPHANIAYERFTDTGPLAILPLSQQADAGRCSMVMTVRNDQLDDILVLTDDEFLAHLQERFGHRLGRFTRVGRRSHFPLKLVTAASHGSGRIILVGNASHYLHPVSGQGFNLAMRDVGVLAELLLNRSCDVIDPVETLADFEQRRARDHRLVERFTDTLARLFTIPFTPLAHARAAGLVTTDIIPFVRHALARQSMGLNVPLPHISAR